MGSSSEITRLLVEIGQGSRTAVDQLVPLVYEELQRVAHRHMKNERAGHTLNTTALVHEAYLKLVDQQEVRWQNRAHFFAVASMAMRRILVNHARARSRDKRGGGAVHLELDERRDSPLRGENLDLVALDEALTRFAAVSERAARVVECRFFGGLTVEETGEALDISTVTVKRDWLAAKAWLRREMH